MVVVVDGMSFVWRVEGLDLAELLDMIGLSSGSGLVRCTSDSYI